MKKNILLPTDFSDNAWSAIVYALKLYVDEECTFYLLHSTKTKVSTMLNLSSKLLEILNDNAMTELLNLKKQAETANANANHDFEVILSSEDLKDAIEIVVKNRNIDLVVMSTKGATAAKEFFFGSNTIKILKKMRLCPILVVPGEYDFIVPKQIAFPTDLNRFYDDIELRPLKHIADLFNSKIRIVHIYDEKKLNNIQEYNLTTLKNYLSDYEHSIHWMPEYAKKSTEINDFIKELEIDILAMVNYKHAFIEHIIKEPVIKKIGFNPIVPFLVIPE
jgi:nucleotide-binding universal stress UspA family protein